MKSKIRLFQLFILSILLCGVVGCKPSETKVVNYPPPSRTIGPADVISALAATNIAASSLAMPDAVYLLPTLRWIEHDFSSGLYVFQTEMGVSSWVSEANDCDKFAMAASFYGKWLNYSSPNRNVSAALAVGEIYYKQGGEWSRGHAINFFVIRSVDALQVVFYEPQRRSVVTLTKSERESVFFWKL